MSSLLKATSKASANSKGKARSSKLSRTDVAGAATDMTLEAGVPLDGEETSEDEQQEEDEQEDDDQDMDAESAEDQAVVTKASKRDKGKGKALDKKTTVSTSDKNVVAAAQKRKDKVLMISSRGITGRMRHLMLDLETLLPHLKKGESVGLVSDGQQ